MKLVDRCWMAVALLLTPVVAVAQHDGSLSSSQLSDERSSRGTQCPPIPDGLSVNLASYSSPYPLGFGVPWGHVVMRTFSGGGGPPWAAEELVAVRAWSFEAPAKPGQGSIYLAPPNFSVVAISECPGDFVAQSTCRQYGANATIRWSTDAEPPPGQCALEPGKTYYLQAAHFSLAQFVNNGVYISTCGCDLPPCVTCPISMNLH